VPCWPAAEEGDEYTTGALADLAPLKDMDDELRERVAGLLAVLDAFGVAEADNARALLETVAGFDGPLPLLQEGGKLDAARISGSPTWANNGLSLSIKAGDEGETPASICEGGKARAEALLLLMADADESETATLCTRAQSVAKTWETLQ